MGNCLIGVGRRKKHKRQSRDTVTILELEEGKEAVRFSEPSHSEEKAHYKQFSDI